MEREEVEVGVGRGGEGKPFLLLLFFYSLGFS